MKRLIGVMALAAAATPAFAGVDVGVSINVAQPGFYGQIDISGAPRPVVIQPQPVTIEVAPRGVVVQPVYLYVPYEHQKKWKKHCHKYDACGRPVYFVREDWYNDQYVPYYRRSHDKYEREDRDRGGREKHRGGHGHGHGHGHKHDD